MKTVTGVRDLGVIKGATGPHIIECDDGRSYVVKFAGPSRAAVNEYVGQSLARSIGLPVPESAFVQLSQEIVSASRDLTYRGILPGVHHGSELVAGVLDFDQFTRLHGMGEVSNPWVLPGTICHDNWILTYDRERGDNHLFEQKGGRFSYLMIDFTHGFTGQDWTADSIDQGSYVRVLMPTYPLVAAAVEGLGSFLPTLERVEAVKDSEIEEVVRAMPPSWGLTDEESMCMVDFLETRRGLLRSILTSNSACFPNWSR